MPPKRDPFPKYQKHSSGQARVRLTDPDGRREDVLLGPYNSPGSKRRYDEELAAWVARGRTLPKVKGDDEPVSVNGVCLAFLKHMEGIWTDDRKRHHETLKQVVAIIRPLCGTDPACSFGPKKLKQIRQRMIDLKGWCRSNLNKNLNLVRRMFRWASEEELVTPSVWHGLLAVENLGVNTPGVREGKKIGPVKPAVYEKTVPFLPPLLRIVARLQRVTGARGGELLAMRPKDIDRVNRGLWRYTPGSHKTEHHGHPRVIVLGERCIELLTPLLVEIGESEFIFSPKRSEELRAAERAKNRKTKLYPSHAKRNAGIKAKAGSRKRPPKKRYAKGTYYRAVERACLRAGVPRWSPHQLRHLVGKEMRAKYGLDATRALLGHRSVSMTEHYSELDSGITERIARESC